MKARSWLFLPSSVILVDAVTIGFGVARLRGLGPILIGIAAHAALAVLFAVMLRVALMNLGRPVTLRGLTLSAVLAFFVPVLGAITLAIGIFMMAAIELGQDIEPFDRYAPPDPFARPPRRRLRAITLSERLLFVARSGRTTEARFGAVLQAKDAPRGVRVQVLKAALADRAEEVRLLAFSQLENIRRSIDSEIEHALEGLKLGPRPKQAWKFHVTLAESYHEIAYLGLAEGEIYKHMLVSALTHARAALAEVPDDASTLRLVGRILLRQSPAGEPATSAREAFEAAIAAGIVRTELAVELAEEAFRRGAYDEARAMIATIDDVPNDHVLVAGIQEVWQ
jgi:hypothetical protein